jgi:hypothetical protein
MCVFAAKNAVFRQNKAVAMDGKKAKALYLIQLLWSDPN